MKSDTTHNASLRDISSKFAVVAGKARSYALALFILFVICIYGFMAWRINTLLTAEPSAEAVNSQVKANAIPKIDSAIVKQLQSLRDNSVSVQALFDRGRSNPFQ